MSVAPYLFFDGACEEAIEFYTTAVGAEVAMLMRYRDAPPNAGPTQLPPGSENKIMHASLKIAGTEIMASDGFCQNNRAFQGFSLSLGVPDAAAAEQVFGALSDGGAVRQPLSETFFSPSFGMLTDKFGVGWLIMAQPA